MRKDRFTDEALAAAKALAELKYSENPEDQLAYAEAYDFARCQRPDGSFYGTGGQCRKGKEAGAKEMTPTEKLKQGAASNPAVMRREKDKATAAAKTKGMFERAAQRRAGDEKTLSELEAIKKEASKDSRTILRVVERGSGGEGKLMPAVKSSIARAEEQGGQAKINADNIKKLLKKRRDQGGILDSYDRKELVGWMRALAYTSNSQAKADFARAKKMERM